MSNASEHADSLARQINAAVDAGAPFGYVHDDGRTASDFDDMAVELGHAPHVLDDMLTTADRIADGDTEGYDDETINNAPTRDEIMDGWHEASAMDYLTDALDIQYLVSSDRTYRAARILIAFGGPNAWIDTHTGQLGVSWWIDGEVRALPSEFIDQLDEACAELWEMSA